ncbi:MAG: hypothetical protein NWE98_02160 [Candidatus Bathyarchaeota archaeon]|nr:hypothetical protein [Candidatus Bathyarchaeota archaeon]
MEKTKINVKVEEVVYDYGNRCYKLSGANDVRSGWGIIDLSKFPEQKKLFFNVKGDTVEAVIHRCIDMKVEDLYYVWEPRKHAFPLMPPACPRCRYRLDYLYKR